MKKKIMKGVIPYSDLNTNLLPEPDEQTVDELFELLMEVLNQKKKERKTSNVHLNDIENWNVNLWK